MKVSVVITTFNRPEDLIKAMRSVFSQSHSVDELIIIDDASDTNYEAALSNFDASKYMYHRLTKHGGANVARNKGVELSQGDVIAFLDDDDIYQPDFIQYHLACYKEVKNSKTTSAVVCGYQVMGKNQSRVNQQTTVTQEALRKGNKFCGISGFSALRTVLVSHPFDESLLNGQDWDLYVRIVMSGYHFTNIPKALFEYRVNSPHGISVYNKTMDIGEANIHMASILKHKAFLGEKHFRYRVANFLLSHLLHKTRKHAWLLKSFQLAGVRISMHVLFLKLFAKIFSP